MRGAGGVTTLWEEPGAGGKSRSEVSTHRYSWGSDTTLCMSRPQTQTSMTAPEMDTCPR